MTQSMCTDTLLPLSTMLANGEILFVCNRPGTENWIQVYAFYQHCGCLYAMTKDFAGLFHSPPYQQGNSFIECRSYYLPSGSVIINIKGEVVATHQNYRWTFAPPGTRLAEFSHQIQGDQSVDDICNKDGNDNHNRNVEPPQRCSANRLYQWFRSVFPKKRLASV